MKTALSENIKAFRRERKMTQEQLAEALGVTVGAVHKWESKASMPEIRLLVEMAGLFCVSVDALLGYEIKSSGAEDFVERIKTYLRSKDYRNALSEAEKALLRYPNTFSVVSCCAETYERMGVETGDRQALMRAIELMERAVPLLSQNRNPQVSEVTIRSDIAVCHILLGQQDKGAEILKRYNAGGINNTLLGLICSQSERFDHGETENYLGEGLGNVVTNAVRGMSGYTNYYIRTGDLPSALDAVQWTAGFLASLKASPDAVCYLDKIISVFQAVGAAVLMKMGRQTEGEVFLREAHSRAAAFDRAPVYGTDAIRFCIGDIRKSTMSDDLGETAMAAIEKMLRSDELGGAVWEAWNDLKHEHTLESMEDPEDE